MFVLAEFRDTVAIKPRHFVIPLHDAINYALNQKFANKVVHNQGLCIALWDVTKVDDSFIFPGDGSSHTIVEFRMVVFRPFMDEILVGKVKSCSSEGLNVTLGFFDDIFIPSDQMIVPSRFDEVKQLWLWDYEDDEGNKHPMSMDIGEQIRFRVVDEIFVDVSPSGPDKVASGDGAAGNPVNSNPADIADINKKSPYTILGSIRDQGLGLLSWWTFGESNGDDADG